MTSAFDYMTKGWATFSRGSDMSGAEAMYELLKEHNITPKEFLTYGDNKTFLDSQLLDTNSTLAFHRGTLVGTYEQVKAYLQGAERPVPNPERP